MPKFRRLSGSDVVAIGFAVVSQRGSHVKLRQLTPEGRRQTLILPNHREIDAGTCRAIFRQASEYIPEAELASYFFVD